MFLGKIIENRVDIVLGEITLWAFTKSDLKIIDNFALYIIPLIFALHNLEH